VCEELVEWTPDVAADAVVCALERGDASPGLVQFRQRVVDAVDRIVARYRESRVALVCHGGVINTVVSRVLGFPWPVPFVPAHASLTRMRVDEKGNWVLHSLGDSFHTLAGFPATGLTGDRTWQADS
jgi:broad specificity phosphatase PhoE